MGGYIYMRVITGSAKGRRLLTPKRNRIRPTTDRIKEAFFSILGEKVINSIFIDCFSGTGSIGIEALSRGAKECYFIDNHHESVSIIKENLSATDLWQGAQIISKNSVSGINELSQGGMKADILFLDPPYLKGLIQPTLAAIIESDILHLSSWIIVEHSEKDIIEHRDSLHYFRKQTYGNITLSFFQKEEV